MHPIVSEQIARHRTQELRREADISRRTAALRARPENGRFRLRLAAAALRLAQALDREGRIVPRPATAVR